MLLGLVSNLVSYVTFVFVTFVYVTFVCVLFFIPMTLCLVCLNITPEGHSPVKALLGFEF